MVLEVFLGEQSMRLHQVVHMAVIPAGLQVGSDLESLLDSARVAQPECEVRTGVIPETVHANELDRASARRDASAIAPV